jgi:hypothetical protein
MIYASTFLSHSSVDAQLVKLVATELGKRGVIAWLDQNELEPGVSLKKALKTAIEEQATITLFLSLEALDSYWVNEELTIALEVDRESGNNDLIIPVFLGDAVEIVAYKELLRKKWFTADGKIVDRLGIVIKKRSPQVDTARQIAENIAARIYKTLKIADQREVIVYIDQRGAGDRHGKNIPIPDNLKESDAPILVFRPDLTQRTFEETLHGTEWENFSGIIEQSLSKALGNVRWSERKKIRIVGNAQLGVPFFLGQIFNRNTSADLYCTNIDGHVFSNQGQGNPALTGGNRDCETPHRDIPSIPSNASLESISLLISTAQYVAPVIKYLKHYPDFGPLVWVESGLYTNNDQVMKLITDIVALVTRLRDNNNISTLFLFCGLPFNIMPLLSANLLHVVDNLIFMEYRRDLQGKNPAPGDLYIRLKTKSGS